MIYTFFGETAEYCRKKGYAVKLVYEADGVRTWEINISSDDPFLKDPEFLASVFKNFLVSGPIVARRLSLPLYTIKQGPFFAFMAEKKDDKVIQSVILARKKNVIRFMFTEPVSGKCPTVVRINRRSELLRLLDEAHKEEVVGIRYFVREKFAEVIPVKAAMNILKLQG